MSSNQTDLDELLDGALDDFDKIPKGKQTGGREKRGKVASIEDDLREFSKFTAEETDEKIREKLKHTVEQLHDMSSSALGEELTEEELNTMFNNLRMEGEVGAAEENFTNLLPMMEGMMQSLMSKELLYPPMKDIADKFPGWLADNRNKITDELYNKYNKQFELTKQICFLFESESETDSESLRRANFEKVMNLMQEMQNLGHPPQELTGDNSPNLQFDEDGNPVFPEGMNPNQCCLQ